MSQFLEFADILRKELKKDLENELFQRENQALSKQNSGVIFDSIHSKHSSLNTEFPSEIDVFPTGFSWLLGQKSEAHKIASIEQSTLVKARQQYGVKIRPRPAHKLNSEQQNAFRFFLSFGIELVNNFSSQELRAAWKKLAFKTHPDHGGSSQMFQKAQQSYLSLQGSCISI